MNQHHIPRPIPQDRLGLLIHAFLDDCELGELSPRTLANYRETLWKFHWWMIDTDRTLDPDSIRPSDIRDYLRYCQSSPHRWNSIDPKAQKPLAPSSLDAYYRRLRAFFSWLVNQEDIDRSPMDARLRRPRFNEDPVDPFTPEDLRRISLTLRKQRENEFTLRDRAIVAVLLDVGLRASELVKLTVADVDIMTGVVLVRQGKGGKTRTVQLGASARRALRKYWLGSRTLHVEPYPTDPLFWSQKRKHLTAWGLAQMTERLGQRAGIDQCNPHRFRHTMATNALRAGMGLLELQTTLGHSDLSMVRRYATIAETDLARAARDHSALDSLNLGL